METSQHVGVEGEREGGREKCGGREENMNK